MAAANGRNEGAAKSRRVYLRLYDVAGVTPDWPTVLREIMQTALITRSLAAVGR